MTDNTPTYLFFNINKRYLNHDILYIKWHYKQTAQISGRSGMFYGVFAFLKLWDVEFWLAPIDSFEPDFIVIDCSYYSAVWNRRQEKNNSQMCCKIINMSLAFQDPSPRRILVFLVDTYGLSTAVPFLVVKQASILGAGSVLVFVTLWRD